MCQTHTRSAHYLGSLVCGLPLPPLRSGTSSPSRAVRVQKMAGGAGSLAALWTEVNRCGQNGDFTRALKAVNKSKH